MPRGPRCFAPAPRRRPKLKCGKWTAPDYRAAAENARSAGQRARESLLHRKYAIPFILACIILACTQLTGVNSIIGYCATILIQAGLSDVAAHWGNVILTSVNFLVTMVGVMLVDRKGRKFLLSLGTAGIIAFACRRRSDVPPARKRRRSIARRPSKQWSPPMRA